MTKLIPLEKLRPNNWFLNKVKVELIRQVWNKGQQHFLPPVLVSEIDGELALINGNTRAFVAWERGQRLISVLFKNLSDIDDNAILYETLHRRGPEEGVLSVCDLTDRILESQEYQKKWVKFCQQLLCKLK